MTSRSLQKCTAPGLEAAIANASGKMAAMIARDRQTQPDKENTETQGRDME